MVTDVGWKYSDKCRVSEKSFEWDYVEEGMREWGDKQTA